MMARRRLLFTLLPLSLAATAACLVVAGLAVRDVVQDAHVQQVERDLRARAALVAMDLSPMLGAPRADVDAAVKRWGAASDARLTLIAPDGTVIADSLADPARMDNHAGRAEVRQARALGRGADVRVSRTLGVRMVYVAMQVGPEGGARPVLRAALPLEALDRSARPAWRALTLAGLAIMAIVATLAWIATRVLSRPLAEYEQAAARYAAGDFSRRLPVSSWHELAGLGEALNGMAAQLDERMRTIQRQASEQAAVLSSMSEGVLAVDASERVISINDAAARLLQAQPRSVGRTLAEVARHPELQGLVRRVLETGASEEAEIVLVADGERHVDVQCTVLRDGRDHGHGAVVVLDDLTQVRRLEAVRRDFVANVSHELRTPVTSIKGFVETLREGAALDPARAERFLGIIARQAERLSAIIDDLLTLARLEQEGREGDVAREPSRILPLLRSAAQACEVKAAERGTPVHVSGDESLVASVNPALLEQAVINLVDNAIKHSEGRPVRVTAQAAGDQLQVTVADEGTGIETEHLPRLFERFYRVDRARSRKEGGTGLGLAIVKHIARVHGGHASVRSEPGQGSAFTLTLPRT